MTKSSTSASSTKSTTHTPYTSFLDGSGFPKKIGMYLSDGTKIRSGDYIKYEVPGNTINVKVGKSYEKKHMPSTVFVGVVAYITTNEDPTNTPLRQLVEAPVKVIGIDDPINATDHTKFPISGMYLYRKGKLFPTIEKISKHEYMAALPHESSKSVGCAGAGCTIMGGVRTNRRKTRKARKSH